MQQNSKIFDCELILILKIMTLQNLRVGQTKKIGAKCPKIENIYNIKICKCRLHYKET